MKAIVTSIISVSVIAGVFFAPYFGASGIVLTALFALFFLFSFVFIPQKWIWLAMIAIGFFFLGIFRFQSASLELDQKKYFDGEEILVRATVDEILEKTDKSTRFLVVDEEKGSRLLVITGFFNKIKYGDQLEIEGKVKSSSFLPNKNALEVRGVVGELAFPGIKEIENSQKLSLKSLLFNIKMRFYNSLNKLIPEPEGSFALGFLLEVKKTLPDFLDESLQKTSTTHLIVLSGFNLGVIVEALRMIFAKKSARLSFWGPLTAILFFIIMTGASPSIMRAGIMGAILVLAKKIGRQSSASTAIVISACFMIIINPYILRYDTGFQLSFLAFIGIIYLSPILNKIIKIKNKGIRELISLTLAAQLLVYPLLVYYFGSFTIVSPIVNFIILPLVPLAMSLSFITGVVGLISINLGTIFGWSAIIPLKLIIKIIVFFDNLSFNSIDNLSLSKEHAFLIYILVFEFIFLTKFFERRNAGRKITFETNP